MMSRLKNGLKIRYNSGVIMDGSESSSLVYSKIAKQYASEFCNPSEHLDEFLALIPNKGNVLDVGCGVGIDSGYMRSKGFDVIGIDLSKGMLKLAKQKFSQVDFRLVDMRKVTFPENSFDGIVASCVLVNIPKSDVFNLLVSFNKFLKRDGLIYLALQAGKSREIYIDEPFKLDEKLFLNIMALEEIKDLLVNAGFKIIKKYKRSPKSKNELNFTKLYVIAKRI